MSKFSPGMGGQTARCLTLLPILTLLILAFSSPVQAQFHGVAMAKNCGPTQSRPTWSRTFREW